MKFCSAAKTNEIKEFTFFLLVSLHNAGGCFADPCWRKVIGAVNTQLTPLECYNAVMCLWYDTVRSFPGVINYF